LPVQHIHTYLVHPRKGSAAAWQVNGTAVTLNGRLFDLLNNIYVSSDRQCDIGITFAPHLTGRNRMIAGT
jgi:muramidase (phage lysozyme)